MTVAVGVIPRKSRCKKLCQPEIPAARLTCFTSGSFRPKLGLIILTFVVLGCLVIFIPVISSPRLLKESKSQAMAELDNKVAVNSVAQANSNFMSKLYNHLKQGHDENVVVSPFSISSVIAMISAGAKGNTAQQIKAVFTFPEDDNLHCGFQEALGKLKSNDNFTLDVANRIYVHDKYELLQSYLDTVTKNYHADPVTTNFAQSEEARDLINNWVEGATKGKIRDLIKSGVLNELTRLVLVNAIYFKGEWAKKFDPAKTTKGPFNLLDGQPVEVDLMSISSDFSHMFVDALNASALEMPYKGDRLSMIFLLPQKSDGDGFVKLEEALATFDLSKLVWPGPARKVNVQIPRFKVEDTHELNDILKAMGLKDMFDDKKADFSAMSSCNDLYVSTVVQKAFIEVNEEGAEASAATAGVMFMRSAFLPQQFICNRPFIYLIKDNLTGLVLFAGRLVNPTL